MSPCVRPGEINDDDLIGYVASEIGDDAAGHRLRQHLAACPRCAALAAEYADLDRRLGRALYRVDCPAALTLGEYHLGLLPAATTRQIAAHLATCLHCPAELATAAGFLDDPAPTPTPLADLARGVETALRRLVATLLPAPVQPALALRGAARAPSWRYSAEDFTLTLQPQRADRPRGQVRLLGFVERHGADLASLTGARVRLLAAGAPVSTTTIDELGNFMTEPVPPGAYDLEINTSDLIVTALELPLGIEA